MLISVVIILLALAGILAGIIAGLFGLGGGILFVPVLLFVFQHAGVENAVLWTVGTSLVCNFVAALSSTFKHYQSDNLFLREGMQIGLFGIAGTYLGRLIAQSPYYSEVEFTVFFSLILLYSVYHFFKKKKPEVAAGQVVRPLRWYLAMVLGLASGLLASLAGVGGGLIMVPAMSIFLSFGYRKVVSISSLAIVLITLAGWIQFALLTPGAGGLTGYELGYVDFGLALPLVAGSIVGARFGVKLLGVIRMRTLEIAFGFLVILVISRLLYGLF
ncbi:sulfite exporter TauE/SafE family protein [Balneolales bacterium ANBcel1]|nr:sulfite exporter TauE/SafE family protein [Balneolales bacterium ANBcel1]